MNEKLRKPVSPEKTWSGLHKNPLLVFMEGVKVSRGWLPKLDPMKSRNGPFSSEKNWSGRNKKPILLFMEGVKFSRSWPLKLDQMKS
ncbi:hypothetical protein PGRAN_06461 [Listeria grandensis FSL F6-0971]|uniref:Uncharacterized protein n=1 Tax=Listeria grandensis FSL F6-0971 TaxID=1265819 RepID=W7BUH4_9LIST|nr:hypothetical protein PGRAN_06461 [Listeria grandensis FSL F6-0971]